VNWKILNATTEEDIGIAYEQQSYRVLAVAGNTTAVSYSYFNGTSWNQSGYVDVLLAGNALAVHDVEVEPVCARRNNAVQVIGQMPDSELDALAASLYT